MRYGKTFLTGSLAAFLAFGAFGLGGVSAEDSGAESDRHIGQTLDSLPPELRRSARLAMQGAHMGFEAEIAYVATARRDENWHKAPDWQQRIDLYYAWLLLVEADIRDASESRLEAVEILAGLRSAPPEPDNCMNILTYVVAGALYRMHGEPQDLPGSEPDVWSAGAECANTAIGIKALIEVDAGLRMARHERPDDARACLRQALVTSGQASDVEMANLPRDLIRMIGAAWDIDLGDILELTTIKRSPPDRPKGASMNFLIGWDGEKETYLLSFIMSNILF